MSLQINKPFEALRVEQSAVVNGASDELALCQERLDATRKRRGVALARPDELITLEKRLTAERSIALVSFDQGAIGKIEKSLKTLPGLKAENDRELADCQVIIDGLEAKIRAATLRKKNAETAVARIDLCGHFPEINKHVAALAELFQLAGPLAAQGDVREFFGVLPDMLCKLDVPDVVDILNVDNKRIPHQFIYNRQSFMKGKA